MRKITFRGVILVPDEVKTSRYTVGYTSGVPVPMRRTYDPFETETALFLQFAELAEFADETTFERKVSIFAIQYGLAANAPNDWRQRAEDLAARVSDWREGRDVELYVLSAAPVSVIFERTKKGAETLLVTDDLWTCLRIQFNLAVTEQWQFRHCAQCGKLFAITPPVGRKTRQYCSTACSSKAYRARKAGEQ